MSEANELRRAEERVNRWRILRTLDAGRPIGCLLSVIAQVVHGPGEAADDRIKAIERELDYLGDLGLVKIGDDDGVKWAKLTPAGVDVVEYNAPVPLGIARPRRAVPQQ